MNSLLSHARSELRHARLLGEHTDEDTLIGRQVLDLLYVYAQQRHRDPGAVIELFFRLAHHLPIEPLSDIPSEWIDAESGFARHRRCGAVQRCLNTGVAFDVQTSLFEDPYRSGHADSQHNAHVEISSFPYLPKVHRASL